MDGQKTRVMFYSQASSSAASDRDETGDEGDTAKLLSAEDTGGSNGQSSEKRWLGARVAYWLVFATVTSLVVACLVLLVLSSPTCNEADKAQVNLAWWKRAVIYQVYPRSVQDSDGDGVGDLQLPGITARLDHLASLGVSMVWLSPIFRSLMVDFGYDISNYTDVDPTFGTLADLRALLDAVHARGMYLLLDYVPNHTSDQHEWFKESRSSRSSSKRDWYVWADAKLDGSPPNNWLGVFGGSAWEWDNGTQQYYLHQFTVQQPGLNYRNPAMQSAMRDVLRFWLNF